MDRKGGMQFFAFFLFLAVLFFLPAQQADAPEDQAQAPASSFRNPGVQASEGGGVLSLPSSLLRIEDGAFEGTAFSGAVLPDTVRAIGDRAFARMPHLRLLNIPDSVTKLGRNAFLGSEAVTLLSSPEGMAYRYAQAHQIRFQALEEVLPAPRQEFLSRRTAAGPALFLLLALLIFRQPRLKSGSAAENKRPLRWRKRAELPPLNLCFP